MSNLVVWLLVFCVGAALGAFFFGGLWWTVLKGIHTKNPGLLFGVSLIVRTATTVAGFVFASGGQIDRLAACLAGFFVARGLVLRITRQALARQPADGKEAGHETEP